MAAINSNSEPLFNTARVIEELPSDDGDDDYEDIDVQAEEKLPLWLRTEIVDLLNDELETATSEAQEEVYDMCRPLLLCTDTQKLSSNQSSLPTLSRDRHTEFLHAALKPLPSGYVAMDASRPWLFYWAICGLTTLGQDVTQYRERLQETLRPLQNPSGGFGGGHGQYSHCAGNYAAVLALAATGGLDMVNREAMWHFLGSMKQADGGFRVAQGAEEDIRGAYCAMTAITLLNLPLTLPPSAPARQAGLESFLDRLGEWIGRCQTYEGGIAAAPGSEAHGAYAFCALACLSIMDAPHISVPQCLDVRALLAWLAGIQTRTEGGFAGRANKLVDACYGHWVGSCWALLEAALAPASASASASASARPPPNLWDRGALIRYLLCCCQQPGRRGGMRDKPSAHPDAYHTCYSLAGLSAAQHHYSYDADAAVHDTVSGRLTAAFNWTARRATPAERAVWCCDEMDDVAFVHPVFVIPMAAVARVVQQFPHSIL